MKKLKYSLAALSVAATLLCATNAVAQYTPDTDYYAAGSSAQFNQFALAAGVDNVFAPGEPALCGHHHWTQKNGAKLHDSRSASILDETGNIWIVWNDAAAAQQPGGRVCYYVTLDSIVGVREYFANATTLMISPIGTADGNIVPLLGPGETIPANIWNIVNNSTINVAHTDIRPEDAVFATLRALTSPAGAQVTGRSINGLGYGPFQIGTPIKSAISSAQANPVNFSIEGNDPITQQPVRLFLTSSFGAAPIMVVGNVSNTAAGHLGDGNYTNINRFNLSAALTGQLCHVRGITSVLGEPDVPLNTFLREPLSGTYNTMEFDIPMSREIYVFTPGVVSGQETGVTTNPLNQTCAPINGATRKRVVGSGEMISTVNSTPDSLGYSFWSFSSFAGKANLKYLTVDGVDPLFSGPSANPGGPGALPQCTGNPVTSCPSLTFPNVVNGTYPIWSYYRAVYDPSDSKLIAPTMISFAQHAAVGLIPDFVPASGSGLTPSMGAFRAHYNQVLFQNGVDIGPNNGFVSGIRETGGDMGGAVLSIQSELDATQIDGPARGLTPQQAQQTNLQQ